MVWIISSMFAFFGTLYFFRIIGHALYKNDVDNAEGFSNFFTVILIPVTMLANTFLFNYIQIGEFAAIVFGVIDSVL